MKTIPRIFLVTIVGSLGFLSAHAAKPGQKDCFAKDTLTEEVFQLE